MTIEELRVLITAKTESLQEGVNKVTSKLKNLKDTSNNVESSMNKNIQNMRNQYDQLLKKLDNVNAQAEMQQRKLDGLRQKYSRVSAVNQDSPKAMKLQEQILKTEATLQRLINTSDTTASKISELDSRMQGAGVATEKTGSKFQSLRDKLQQIKDKFNETGSTAQKNTGRISGFANMLSSSLMRVLRRLFIYNLIYKAIRGLGSYMNSAMKTNNQFVNSLNTIKTNLRITFQPIYEFILPALNALMSALATITGYLASLMSALFGKTFKQSRDSAKGLHSATSAMDGYGSSAQKAAKKVKGALAGFDEINVLQTKPDEAGGGGGGGGAGGFEWTDAQIPEYNFTWLDKFKEKLEPTIEALGRLKTALMPMKDFVAQGAIDFYNKFLVPVGNWVFGEGLPRFIDALADGLSKINWDRINQALATLWDALAPFAINVGEGLLWIWENALVPLGTWVGNEIVPRFLEILAGVLEVLNSTIEVSKPALSWLWDNFLVPLAKWTGGAVVDALDGVAFALEKIAEHIAEIPDIITNSDGFFDAFINIGTHIVTGLLDGIYNAIMGIDAWLWDNLVKPIIDAVKKLFGIKSPSTVFKAIGEDLINGLLEGISGTWSKIIDYFSRSLDNIKTFFSSNWEEIKKNANETWEAIKKFFEETWNSIKSKTEESWNNIKSFLIDKIWNPIKSTALTIWTGIKTNILNPINQAKNELSTKWNEIKLNVLNKWEEIRKGIADKKEALISAIKSPFETAKTWINGIVKEAYSWGKNLIGEFIDGLKSKLSNVGEAAKSVAKKVGSYIGFQSPTKEGPGKYADKWMPNMMDMLADGIKSNIYKIDTSVGMAANALRGLDDSNSITNQLKGLQSSLQGGPQVSIAPGDVSLYLDEREIGNAVIEYFNRQSYIGGKKVIR